jgi:hypothetical protein
MNIFFSFRLFEFNFNKKMNKKITYVKPLFKIFKDGEKLPSSYLDTSKNDSKLTNHESLKAINKRLKELSENNKFTNVCRKSNMSFAENPKNDSKPLVREFLKVANKKLKEIDLNMITRDEKTKIVLYSSFLKIGQIDNINQRFEADVYIEAQWEDNKVIEDTFNPSKYWTPDLYIENVFEDPNKYQIKYKVIKSKNSDQTIVVEMINISGFFYEKLELNDFPIGIIFFADK